MKKYIFSFMTLLVMVLSGLLLTSCSEDDLVTNQYQKGVALNVFGPSPVVRGGTLRFLGSNLDQVAQVIIPGVDPITNIEVVQAGIPSEIRVVVPKDGPEVGKIQLIDKTGKVLTTQTELTYTEDIEFEKFTPEDVMAGQEITIIGDYLNLIHMVEFADGVQVSEKSFTQHDRYTIKVLVPEEAQTGKIKLYDVDLTVQDPDAEDVSYNIVQSEKVLHVGTPTTTKIKGRTETAAQGTITAKQGETITISGSYMNLVTGVKIGGVEALEVEVAQDGKSVTAKLPAEAPDGEIALVCKSGVEVPAGTLTTVAPTELKVEAAAVKAGTTLTVTGKDLDVVTSVSFPNAGQVSEIEVSATSLSVNVPTKAQEGELTLSMANGKTVTTTYALVKPTAISYNSNPASAGSSLVITGTDLDLITSVAFGASIQKNVEANADGTALTVKIPLDGESGKLVLSLDNGTSIEAPELTVDKPAFCYVPDPTLLTDNDLKAGDLLI
ncbi:MAG: polygalacturonase, partial [Prevotella sp.]|nr:polygalacturonase [Prevotella sp.]